MKLVARSLALAGAIAAAGASALTLTAKKEATHAHELRKKHHHHKMHHKTQDGWTFHSAAENANADAAAATDDMKSPVGWSVNAADYANTMTLTCVIEVNGIEPPAGTLAAFAGTKHSNECRGVQAAPLSPPFGPFAGKQMYLITVYGDNAAETLSFKFQPSDGTPPIDLDQVVKFKVNANKGNVVAPFRLSGASAAPTLTTSGPPTWAEGKLAFDYAAFENSMTLTTTVKLPAGAGTGGLQEAGTLAAFSRLTGELRGVENTPLFPPFGPFAGHAVFPLMVYGHGSSQGEPLEFKFFDGVQVFDLPQDMAFMANDAKGNVVAPLCLGDCLSGSGMSGAGMAGPPPPPAMPAYAMR